VKSGRLIILIRDYVSSSGPFDQHRLRKWPMLRLIVVRPLSQWFCSVGIESLEWIED